MPFWKHTAELRRRLLISAAALLVTSIPAFLFRDHVMAFTLAQSRVTSLAFIHPTEPLTSYLKLSVSIGFLSSLPIIALQAWRFLCPGLTDGERRAIAGAAVLGGILFYVGCAFGFLVVSRAALSFLLSMAGSSLQEHITIGNYVSFITGLTLLLGLAFQLPIVIAILVRLDLVSVQTLRAKRRHMIVGVWILAAMLTPPDVMSQALLAVPLMLLYELSITIARVTERRISPPTEVEDQG